MKIDYDVGTSLGPGRTIGGVMFRESLVDVLEFGVVARPAEMPARMYRSTIRAEVPYDNDTQDSVQRE